MSQEIAGRIDLHLHSNASDGGLPPDEVVAHFSGQGYSVLALTDHDTIAGCPTAIAAGREAGVRVIAASEFSVGVTWGEMHLLGYFLPTDCPELAAFLVGQQEMRLGRAHKIVERLDAIGVNIGVEEVLSVAKGGAVGRPHVARVLVENGLVPDVETAFRRYLGPRQPAFVPKALPPLNKVTDLVRKLGGVTSAAHLRGRATRPLLQEIADAGVDAVEVIHPAHNDAIIAKISNLAEGLGLLRSGGSDWHGLRPECHDGLPLEIPEVPLGWLEEIEALHTERMAAL